MGRRDGGHGRSHHLLEHKGSSFSVAIRRRDAGRDENTKAQGESDQFPEREVYYEW